MGNSHLQKPRTWMDFVVSVFGHSVVVAVLILLPLYFTQAINMPQFEKTLLVAPPPPPPPAPSASQVASSEESRARNWAACSAASWEESVTRRHRLRPLPSFTKGPTAWEAKCRRRA